MHIIKLRQVYLLRDVNVWNFDKWGFEKCSESACLQHLPGLKHCVAQLQKDFFSLKAEAAGAGCQSESNTDTDRIYGVNKVHSLSWLD